MNVQAGHTLAKQPCSWLQTEVSYLTNVAHSSDAGQAMLITRGVWQQGDLGQLHACRTLSGVT